jgi:hypothetical protein
MLLGPNEAITILIELHKGVGGGHFFAKIIIKNVLDARY